MTYTTALTDYVQRIQADSDALYAREYKNLTPPRFTIDPLQKRDRIVRTDMRTDGAILSRSVHCFVDRATGDILKPAGWKAPAKGARGNIYAETAPTASADLYLQRRGF